MRVICFFLALVILAVPPAHSVPIDPNNLLVNPGAETGDFSGWTIVNGGDGWAVNNDPALVLTGSYSFRASYDWGSLSQEINLTADGYNTTYLDDQPTVRIYDYALGTPEDYSDPYEVKIELRDGSHNAFASFDSGVLTGTENWSEVVHEFTGYGPGVRYIYFEQDGKDAEHWSGQFGVAFDDAGVYLDTYPPPLTATPGISPAAPLPFQNLSCDVTAVNHPSDLSNVSIQWYQDGVNQTALATTYDNLPSGANTVVSTIPGQAGGSWHCSVEVQYNDTAFSGWIDSSAVDVTACRVITTDNEYVLLTTDTSTTGTCFNVQADNVTIDCANHAITGDNSSNSDGIYSNHFNTTVRDCIISNFSRGVYFQDASNSTIYNTSASTSYDYTFSSDGVGILLDTGSLYDTIINSSGTSATGIGIYVDGADDNAIINSTGTSEAIGTGINIHASVGNYILNSTGIGNDNKGIDIFQGSGNTAVNSTGISNSDDGIFVGSNSNITLISSTGTSNSGTGIYVDSSGNLTLTDCTGSSGAHQAGIFLYSSSNATVTGCTGISVLYYGIYLEGGSDNVTLLNCTGTSNLNAGIFLGTVSNDTFTNCTGTSSSYIGIYLQGSSNNTFIATTGSALGTGIFLQPGFNNTFTGCNGTGSPGLELVDSSSGNKIANSTLDGNGGTYAVVLQSGSNTGNVLINDTILNANTLLYLDAGAGGNAFCWNNFTDAGTFYVDDANGSNNYDSPLCNGEGNIWANVMDGSVPITGTASSSGFPALFIGSSTYDDSTSLGMVSGVSDSAPLTPFPPSPLSIALIQPGSPVQLYVGEEFNVSFNTTCSAAGGCGITNTTLEYQSSLPPDPFGYTGGYQYWTVPAGVTSITINVSGASGGYDSGGNPGMGANMVGTFSVTPGQVLSILVGQSPGLCSGSCNYPAGGGGSFVGLGADYSNATPLIAAGGGGGAGSSATGVDAPVTEDGTGDSPGTGGDGAPSVQCAGGGGGFYSSGGSDTEYPGQAGAGGAGFQQGGAGGTDSDSSYQRGGFGGGAQADYIGFCNTAGGSGGGYSGGSGTLDGSGKDYGEAGGSYNSGTSQANTPGYNDGNGEVIISYGAAPQPVSTLTNGTPFRTSALNPEVDNLSENESAIANFTVNATGSGSYAILGSANSSNFSNSSGTVAVRVYARVPPTPVQLSPDASAYAPVGSDVSLNFSCTDGVIDDLQIWTDLNGTWGEAYDNSSYYTGDVMSVPFYSVGNGFYHWAVYCHATYGGSAWSPNRTINVTTSALSDCQDLTDPGTYLLSTNITTSNDCFNVYADNVTLDCLGHSITGPGSNYDGVNAEYVSGTVIRNCTFADFYYGIYFDDASYGQVVNNTFSSNEYGLYLDYDTTGSDYNYVGSNRFSNNYFGFYDYGSDSNVFAYNNVTNTLRSNFGGTSCPFLYSWNGTANTFVSDVSRSGRIGSSTRPKGGRSSFPEEYTKISGSALKDDAGNYSIKLTEEYDEITYLDKVGLISVDHSPEVDFYPGFLKANFNTLYTVNKTLSPVVSCINETGGDCLPYVGARDGYYLPNPMNMTLGLGNLSGAGNIKLLISIARAPREFNSSGKSVQVRLLNGSWKTAYSGDTFTSAGGMPRTAVIDLTGQFQNGTTNYSVKLSLPTALFDFVGVDTTPQAPLTLTNYSAASADLHFRGYSQLKPGIDPSIDYYDSSPLSNYSHPTGNFTKYGDVLPLLGASDDEFVIMHHGDEISMTFPSSAPAAGLQRDFVLYSNAWYKMNIDFNGSTVGPLPFAAMTYYPYNSTEHYPNDAAHNAYLGTWNTRQYFGNESDATGGSFPNSFNNTIFANSIDGGPSSTGLYFYEEDSTSVTHNSITNTEVGIYAESSQNLLMSMNNITNQGDEAVYLYEVAYSNVTRNTMDNVDEGVYAEYCDDLTISANNITNAGYGVDFYGSYSNIVSGNLMANLSDYAVDLGWDCYDSNFTGNNMSSSDWDVYADSSTEGNVFLHNSMTGDYWVDDESGLNSYNDSHTGNRYYLSNGTGSWLVYNITDTNHDGYADEGTDVPFSDYTGPGGDGYWASSGEDWHPATSAVAPTPQPPPGSGGRAGTTQAVTLGESFNCSSGVLTVTATSSGDGVPGLSVKVFGTSIISYSDAKTTGSQGEASFTLPASGEYSVYVPASGSYAQASLDPAEFELCQAQNVTPPQNGTQNQTQGAGNQSGQQNITPPQNVTPPANQTQPGNQTSAQLAANSSINAAQAAIDAAKKAGKDTTAAEAKLKEAKDAYNSGDYAQATTLSEQAISLASAAAPAKQNATGPTVAPVQPQQGTNWLLMLGVLVVIVGVGGAAAYLLTRPPKKYK